MKRKEILMGLTIIVLLGILGYSFVISPSIDKYILGKQIEAQEIIIYTIVEQIQQTGYIQIPVGEDVLTLVPYISDEKT